MERLLSIIPFIVWLVQINTEEVVCTHMFVSLIVASVFAISIKIWVEPQMRILNANENNGSMMLHDEIRRMLYTYQ